MRALVVTALFSTTACASVPVVGSASDAGSAAHLEREITKVRFAIERTEQLIAHSRGEAYVPELYVRLAKLIVDEARYHYLVAYEGQHRRSRAVDAVQPKLLKKKAIAVYARILDEFADYSAKDEVLFSIAHEYRELGEYDSMSKYLTRVVDEHPKSRYWAESLLIMGDHHFDRSELEEAATHYRRIIRAPESESHPMARYKLAWVRINQEKFKAALTLFEAVVEGLRDAKKTEGRHGGRNIDLRREALVDIVFPYTEVHKKVPASTALSYFKKLADSRATYLAALNKLARRWFVKARYEHAAGIYREVLTLGTDEEDAVEWARRLYDGVKKGKKLDHAATDVALLAEVAARGSQDWRAPATARAQVYAEFEVYARDLATKAHLQAKADSNKRKLARAGDAYDAYLAFFSESDNATAMRQNLAEVRYAAAQHLLAARAYETLLDLGKTTDEGSAMRSAVSSYSRALQTPWRLTRSERAVTRARLRRTARRFIERFPQDDTMVAVKFNVAKTHYDAAAFEHAAELFAALVEQYPTSAEANVSAELALDSLRSNEAFEEMADLGQVFLADSRLSPKVRRDVAQMVKNAEARALDVVTLDASIEGDDAADSLIAFAKRHRGTDLGERAMVNAFVTAQSSDDLSKAETVGKNLMQQYPDSKAVGDVLATLGRMSAQASDFERAADYLEEAAGTNLPRERAASLYHTAALIRAHVGDTEGAADAFGRGIARTDKASERRLAANTFAGIMVLRGDKDVAADALEKAIDLGVGDAPELNFTIAYTRHIQGRTSEAHRQFASAIAMRSLITEPEEFDAVAGSAYYLVDPLHQRYDEIDDSIADKFGALAELEAALLEVVEGRSGRWMVAALARLAAAYGEASRFLGSVQAPAGLDSNGVAQFRAALASKARAYEDKKTEALEACADKAGELRVFSEAARACMAGRPFTRDPEQRPVLSAPRAVAAADLAALKSRVAKNSKDFDAVAEMARLYMNANDLLRAKLVLDKASEGGANATIFTLRGEVADRLGEPAEAHADYSSALDADGDGSDARRRLAELYERYGHRVLAESERARLGVVSSKANHGASASGVLAEN